MFLRFNYLLLVFFHVLFFLFKRFMLVLFELIKITLAWLTVLFYTEKLIIENIHLRLGFLLRRLLAFMRCIFMGCGIG
jgi:hypothetical protein